MTQQHVAERLQVEPETISRIESGAIVPTLQRLRQFAEVYGCPMESLIGRTSDQAADVAKRLTEELADLAPADRAFVAEQTQALVNHIKASRRRSG
jgi:transcriptional regulator with XRE-family HTH domain